MHRLGILFWAALALLICGTRLEVAAAQPMGSPPTSPPTARHKPAIAAVRVEQGPVVDGRLDDPVWQVAPAGEIQIQYLPNQNVPVSEKTEFRILYDQKHIYLGVWCHDTEPDRIVARLMEREGPLWLDDNIIFVFDTFLDLRNGYVFFVNPNGARRDGLISGNVNENHDWDGIWSVRTTIDQEGWKVEVAIPFATLNFDPNLSTWGFNLDRTIQRKAESGRWSGAEPQFRTGNVSEAGHLTGMHGLKQGLGLELRPFLLGRGRQQSGDPGDDYELEWGGDIRYSFTPKLSGTLSYNTDFAETEVDLRQINLTRFPLFFPEKRHFFLEDSGVFNFAGLRSTELIPFFSRRIGLSQEGQRVPIDFAAKLSGQVGPYQLGVISALLDAGEALGSEHALAARVSRNVLEQSSAGLLFTTGDPNAEADNHLLGADFRYRTTRFQGDKVLEANFFALGSLVENGGASQSSPAYGFNAAYPNDRWMAEVRFHEIGEDFNPALGFVPRTGVRSYKSLWSFRPRPDAWEQVRQLRFTYENEFFTDPANHLESARHRFTPLFIDFASSDKLSFFLDHSYDAPRDDFVIGKHVVILAGDYQWIDYTVRLDVAPKRLINGFLEAGLGEFYNGTRRRHAMGLDILPWKYLSLRLNYDYNRVDLPVGEFETHLGALRLGWHFTPDLFWSHLIQYDSLSDTLGYHSRIRWDFRPGSSVFLVYNQSFIKDQRTFVSQATEAILKLGMVFRF